MNELKLFRNVQLPPQFDESLEKAISNAKTKQSKGPNIAVVGLLSVLVITGLLALKHATEVKENKVDPWPNAYASILGREAMADMVLTL